MVNFRYACAGILRAGIVVSAVARWEVDPASNALCGDDLEAGINTGKLQFSRMD